jgi:hypothetical protein
MKKVVSFILAFLYLGITTGLVVNIHYCMGAISDVRFDNLNDESCKCGSKMPCCKHDYQLVKVNDEHQQVAVDANLKSPEIQLHTIPNLILVACLDVVTHGNNSANPPPLLSPPDIYIKNRVFKI